MENRSFRKHFKTSWTHYTGYYTATETTKVKVAITNGTASTNGNDFAIDNIGIKPVEGKTDNHLTDMKTSNEVISWVMNKVVSI